MKTMSRLRAVVHDILSDKGQGKKLPTSLTDLALNERLVIKPITTGRRFEGRLELCAGKPTIFINDHGRGLEYPRARFTLAHELGHFFLHRRWLHAGRAFHDAELLVGDELREVEREANAFAAECLLPEQLVERFLSGRLLSLERVQQLADDAKASLKATAIRVAKLSRTRCCFYLEQDGLISWAAPSDDWREARHVWSGWKGKCPQGSAVGCEAGGFEEREVPLQVWCPNARMREEPLFESALQTSHGRLILVFDGAGDDFLS